MNHWKIYLPQYEFAFPMRFDKSELGDELPFHPNRLLHHWCQSWKCYHSESTNIRWIKNNKFKVCKKVVWSTFNLQFTLICIFCFDGIELQLPEAHNFSNPISSAISLSLTISSSPFKWNPSERWLPGTLAVPDVTLESLNWWCKY